MACFPVLFGHLYELIEIDLLFLLNLGDIFDVIYGQSFVHMMVTITDKRIGDAFKRGNLKGEAIVSVNQLEKGYP